MRWTPVGPVRIVQCTKSSGAVRARRLPVRSVRQWETKVDAPVQRSPTGVPGLDEVMNGGFIAGRLYLVEGSPGSGKTTLALQYLLQGVAANERCLYVTLSETGEELRAGAASHGWRTDGIEFAELVFDDELRGDEQITMYHPAEVELSDTMRRMLEIVERAQPRRLVVDSLSELRLVAQDSLRYRRQIMALKQAFVGRDCTVLLL